MKKKSTHFAYKEKKSTYKYSWHEYHLLQYRKQQYKFYGNGFVMGKAVCKTRTYHYPKQHSFLYSHVYS